MIDHPDQDSPRDETVDVLSRTLTIAQLRRGHRAASDDVLLAWAAARACPDARAILDLGTGKGVVALLLARRLPASEIWGVEAEPVSWGLAVRNAARNGLERRYHPLLGDFRDASLLAGLGPFEIVCGAPPFMPLGSGVEPRERTRLAGRFELRGGVEVYAAVASEHLAREGRLTLLMPGHLRPRTETALRGAGLHPAAAVEVKPRPGRAPTYWIVTAGAEPVVCVEETVCLRAGCGDGWSPAYARIRRELDLP